MLYQLSYARFILANLNLSQLGPARKQRDPQNGRCSLRSQAILGEADALPTELRPPASINITFHYIMVKERNRYNKNH
jgi:hypothetical protein